MKNHSNGAHAIPHEIRHAQHEVEERRLELDDAITQLEDKLEDSRRRYRGLIRTIESPRRVIAEHPFGTMAMFAVFGFLLGGRATRIRAADT